MAAFPAVLLVLLLALPLPAPGGPGPEPGGTGESAVPPLGFESVFDAYQPYRHQPAAPWRQSNERVGEIGGWRTYAREAAAPAGPGSVAPAEPAVTEEDRHHGGAP